MTPPPQTKQASPFCWQHHRRCRVSTPPPQRQLHWFIELRDNFTQLEIRQEEMEQSIFTLQSGQATAHDKNKSPPRLGDTEGERGLSALLAEIKKASRQSAGITTADEAAQRNGAKTPRWSENADQQMTCESTTHPSTGNCSTSGTSPSQSVAPPSQETQTQETLPCNKHPHHTHRKQPITKPTNCTPHRLKW